MKTSYLKKFAALSAAGILSSGIAGPSYAAGIKSTVIPPTKIYIDTSVEQVKVEKKILDYDTAIKKALEYSITSKSAELQRETLQDKMDELYYRYDTLFEIKDPNVLEGTLANLEIYNKSLSTNRDLMLRQKTVDSEQLKITVAGLFNNIEQQLKLIEFANNKIAQGKENIILFEKQYDLGMISEHTLKQAVLENKALENDLRVQGIKLSEFYAELEKTTGISDISENYDLKPLEMEYKEVTVSDIDIRRYKADIQNFDIGILSKQNAVENKTTAFDNYPQTYNFAYLSWLAGNQPQAPDFDYKSTRDEKNVAELDLSQTVINAGLNVEKNYAALQQLQQSIAVMRLELEKLTLNIANVENRYKLGMESKNTYQNTLLSKQELETKLSGMIVQQKQLRLLFESPYFAGMTMGA